MFGKRSKYEPKESYHLNSVNKYFPILHAYEEINFRHYGREDKVRLRNKNERFNFQEYTKCTPTTLSNSQNNAWENGWRSDQSASLYLLSFHLGEFKNVRQSRLHAHPHIRVPRRHEIKHNILDILQVGAVQLNPILIQVESLDLLLQHLDLTLKAINVHRVLITHLLQPVLKFCLIIITIIIGYFKFFSSW